MPGEIVTSATSATNSVSVVPWAIEPEEVSFTPAELKSPTSTLPEPVVSTATHSFRTTTGERTMIGQ